MKYNKIKPYVYFSAVILFIAYAIFGSDPKSKRIEYLEIIRGDFLNGIIVEKYIDTENHNYKILEIRNFDNKEITWYLNYDVTAFYESVSVGDSIFKQENSAEITIIHNNEKRKYLLDFNTN